MTPILITRSLLWCISLLGTSLLAAEPACRPTGAAAVFSFEEAQAGGITRIAGVRGQALHLDGKGQFIELPASSSYDVGEGDFTIELWMRTSKRQAASLIDKRDSSPRGYQVYLLRDTIGLQVANGGHRASAAPSAYPVIDGQWHHVVAVCKRLPPQAPAMFVDGELRTQKSISSPLENLDTARPLWIGRHHPNGLVPRDNIYFEGDLDEIVLYRRALTATEVRSRFRAFAPRRLAPCR